jgi:NlpC/P60 family putative phage cell wall peptidase
MSVKRAEIVAEARKWLGTPYQHQQSAFGLGCDCLGLVRGVWRGIYGSEPEQPPAYSPDWGEADGSETMLQAATRHMTEKPVSEALPGDVLMFRWRPHLPAKHCAIMTEAPDLERGSAGRIIHAYDGAGFVAEGHLGAWAERAVACFSFPDLEAD